MRRNVVVAVLMAVVLSVVLAGCRQHGSDPQSGGPPPASCTPPPGGRCAADVAWTGPIDVSADGLRLHRMLPCGGTLHATETSDRVTLTLHVRAMPTGSLSCALVDVGVRLASPLGHRTVVDSVSGHTLRTVHG
jgi:hypothetical protein